MRIAIVTVYFPNNENVKNISLISKQVDRTFICDNSPDNNQYMFKEIISSDYYSFPLNLGLSAAFNKVLKNEELLFSDNDYVIFFDQDSRIKDGHVSALIRDFDLLKKHGYKVGCFGPIYYENNRKKILIQKEKYELIPGLYSVKSIITSSMLCQFGCLKEIGFWNDSVFLDMADWDLCWRMIAKGYLCVLSKNVILEHTLGDYVKKIGFFYIKAGGEFRNYYQVRESLYLINKNYTPLKFKLRFILLLFVRNPIRIIFLKNRKGQLVYMIRGYKDWKKGKTGSIDDYNIGEESV